MLDIETIKKIDSSSMFQVYDNWAKIAKHTYESDIKILEVKDIDHIVFVGMGGSGTIGDIFSSILSKTNIHVSIVKGYTLPKTIDKNSLVIFTSVSGNTLETLSALKESLNFDCKTMSFSSGGIIEKFCAKNNLDYMRIKKYHSPRASLISYLYSMLKIFEYVIPIEKNHVLDSIEQLEKLNKKISSKNLSDFNPAISLANQISGIPLIYYPWGFQSVAIRFKNSLQENTKIHAITEDVVEASHNGIVAWEKSSDVQPILLQGKDDHVKTLERWRIFKTFFETKNIKYLEVFSIEGNILSKIISLIYLLDYSSIYKAILSNIDPSPVKPIEYIKFNLKD